MRRGCQNPSPAKCSVRRAAASVGRDDEKKADDLETGRCKQPRAEIADAHPVVHEN
jgi:hypothetical protein